MGQKKIECLFALTSPLGSFFGRTICQNNIPRPGKTGEEGKVMEGCGTGEDGGRGKESCGTGEDGGGGKEYGGTGEDVGRGKEDRAAGEDGGGGKESCGRGCGRGSGGEGKGNTCFLGCALSVKEVRKRDVQLSITWRPSGTR